MNQFEFYAAIDAHIASWNPTLIVRDNENKNTQGVREYIRVTTDGGEGFLTRRTGILEARGNYVRHPVFIRFRIHTKLHTGITRMNELIQSVTDHWLLAQLDSSLHLDSITNNRVGEETPHYVHIVDIGGHRDERRP